MEFKDRLKKLRLKRNMTQSQVADVLYVSTAMVELMERGELSPSMKDVIALKDYFGVSLAYLLGESDEH